MRSGVPSNCVSASVYSRLRLAGAGAELRHIQLLDTRNEWQPRQVDGERDLAPLGHLQRVSREAEAGHVGRGTYPNGQHRIACGLVEFDHAGTGGGEHFGRALFALGGRGDETRAEWLGQDQHVAGLRRCVREDTVGVDCSGDGETELDLGVANGVPAEHGAAGECTTLRPTGEDLAEPAEVELSSG